MCVHFDTAEAMFIVLHTTTTPPNIMTTNIRPLTSRVRWMFGKILFISVFSIVRMTSAPWMADYFTIMELPSRSSSYEPVYSKC